jgi:hypothetical protein
MDTCALGMLEWLPQNPECKRLALEFEVMLNHAMITDRGSRTIRLRAKTRFGYPEEDVACTRGGAPLRTDAKQLFWKIGVARTSLSVGRQLRRHSGTDFRARDAGIAKRACRFGREIPASG